MILTSIALRDFRCHKSLKVDFDSPTTWIVGANGIGKTSLIEAIYFLGRLKSHRTGMVRELIRHGADSFTIQGKTIREDILRINKTNDLRELYHNENKIPLEEFYGQLPVVIFSSLDLQIIRNGGNTRRSYLNAILAHTNRALINPMLKYNRILLQRATELKKTKPDIRTLETLTHQVIKEGKPLQEARLKLATLVAAYAGFFHKHISNSKEQMKIKIYPTSWEINLEAEIQQRRNLLGWQRDNIEIYIQGKAAHKFASEGQQRTAALALRAAEYIILRQHSNHPPLVLVDDVLGELDTARREALTSLLDPDCQLIVTSTKTEEINRKKTALKPDTITLS